MQYFRTPISTHINGMSFRHYTPEEMKKLSVVEITNPIIYDALNQPIPQGLYDSRMGPVDQSGTCETCKLNGFSCPGHVGHIDLTTTPVYYPPLFNNLFKLLKCMCWNCKRFLLSDENLQRLVVGLRCLDAGMIKEFEEIQEMPKTRRVYHRKKQSSEEEMEEEEDDDDDENLEMMDKTTMLASFYNEAMEKISENGLMKNRQINEFRLKVVNEFFNSFNQLKGKCQHCHATQPELTKDKDARIFLKYSVKTLKTLFNMGLRPDEFVLSTRTYKSFDVEDPALSRPKYIAPSIVSQRLQEFFNNELDVFKALWCNITKNKKIDNHFDHRFFFLSSVLVPPNKLRPPSFFDGKSFDHSQNTTLLKILNAKRNILTVMNQMQEREKSIADEINQSDDAKKIGQVLKEDKEHQALLKKFYQMYLELQRNVNMFYDSGGSPDLPSGLKQLLEKKEGLFRMNIMGKRVNYSARSVISPDVNLLTNEIGVPQVFAKTLTYPEPVTELNVESMRTAVENGPNVYPGANFIELSNGRLINLSTCSQAKRTGLAKSLLTEKETFHTLAFNNENPKRVYRHLRNGDMLLVNRQPTLHTASMMSHKAKILTGQRTIRMHYANCSTYNADFDGDEMNLHLPQNDLATVEARMISNTDNQYVSKKDGSPLRGLIQDHIVSGVLLTRYDSFLSKGDFCRYLYIICQCIDEVFGKTYKIDVPQPTILKPKPFYTGKQIVTCSLKHLAKHFDNQLINLKSKCKVKSNSWVIPRPFEGEVLIRNSEFLTGVLDKSQLGASKNGLVHACYELYSPKAANAMLSAFGRVLTLYLQSYGFTVGIEDMVTSMETENERKNIIQSVYGVGVDVCKKFIKEVDEMKGKFNEKLPNIRKVTRELPKVYGSPEMHAKIDSRYSATLNKTTSTIIAEMLPKGLLKPFPRNFFGLMTSTGAKGSMVNFSQICCLLGQQALEGRRVPIMQSGKSLPAFLPYDMHPSAGGFVSSRFLTGLPATHYYFHCMAGREGLVDTAVKTATSGYLQRCVLKGMESLSIGYDHSIRDSDGSIIQFLFGEDCINPQETSYLYNFDFLTDNVPALMHKYNPGRLSEVFTDSTSAHKYHKKIAKRIVKNKDIPDPVLSLYSPSGHIGAVSEKFFLKMTDYLNKNEDKLSRFGVSVRQVRTLLYVKYLTSLADPGMAVGVLAAQSLGEPATQMTLNTFHLAGHGAVNVTLGIPRLKEILMSASKQISTPMMTIPLDLSYEQAQRRANEIRRISLDNAWNGFKVVETVDKDEKQRVYTIKIDLEDCEYRDELVNVLEKDFLPLLCKTIFRSLNHTSSFKTSNKMLRDHEVNRKRYKIVLGIPISAPKILLVSVIEKIAAGIAVREIENIGQCFVVETLEDGINKINLQTEGVNFEAIHKLAMHDDAFDVNKIDSNDIYQILLTYGVEAARQSIVNQISNVFGVYGITVDTRHLSLAADFMTFNGEFNPFNRQGIAVHSSPLLKMSFETTCNFLKSAAQGQEMDDMKTPAARITVGEPVKVGTGAFDILQPLI
eukprot:TRINITY_DN3101_c1_g5_i2.p1 TRINITY_DN3101_c1_g5~~TRINITY_DN3101_c1_g5_i2.p1  ORF type:complete len:1531 (+),score=458.12 TRINITY_DN3101_c1_g5_i2:3277-7869(+)